MNSPALIGYRQIKRRLLDPCRLVRQVKEFAG
jgi:hypothetical protein